ncbi:hypothetical protein SESBI_42370 [Sesbania bispinosa]|nr:hypothetical protein SESBI_42370 [Sesbania bispinosa]
MRKGLRSNEELIHSSEEESRLLRDQLFGFMESCFLGPFIFTSSTSDLHQPPSID